MYGVRIHDAEHERPGSTVACVRRAWCCMTASKVWCCGAVAGVVGPVHVPETGSAALTSSARSVASRSASAEPGSACSARRRSSTCHHTTATRLSTRTQAGNNLTHDGLRDCVATGRSDRNNQISLTPARFPFPELLSHSGCIMP